MLMTDMVRKLATLSRSKIFITRSFLLVMDLFFKKFRPQNKKKVAFCSLKFFSSLMNVFLKNQKSQCWRWVTWGGIILQQTQTLVEYLTFRPGLELDITVTNHDSNDGGQCTPITLINFRYFKIILKKVITYLQKKVAKACYFSEKNTWYSFSVENSIKRPDSLKAVRKQALRRGLRSCSVYRACNAPMSKLS